MWEMERCIGLLLGEIPRLRDGANDYGPLGKDFITHVDIPNEAQKAFDHLRDSFRHLVRITNPKFAS